MNLFIRLVVGLLFLIAIVAVLAAPFYFFRLVYGVTDHMLIVVLVCWAALDSLVRSFGPVVRRFAQHVVVLYF